MSTEEYKNIILSIENLAGMVARGFSRVDDQFVEVLDSLGALKTDYLRHKKEHSTN